MAWGIINFYVMNAMKIQSEHKTIHHSDVVALQSDTPVIFTIDSKPGVGVEGRKVIPSFHCFCKLKRNAQLLVTFCFHIADIFHLKKTSKAK